MKTKNKKQKHKNTKTQKHKNTKANGIHEYLDTASWIFPRAFGQLLRESNR
jgi:hypothetical protein